MRNFIRFLIITPLKAAIIAGKILNMMLVLISIFFGTVKTITHI